MILIRVPRYAYATVTRWPLAVKPRRRVPRPRAAGGGHRPQRRRLPSRTTRRARPQERLGTAVALGRVGPIPDERLRGDVEITRPRYRAVASSDPAEQGIVGAKPLEHRTPQQILDVAFDDGTVGQGETESSAFEWYGRSNAKQHGVDASAAVRSAAMEGWTLRAPSRWGARPRAAMPIPPPSHVPRGESRPLRMAHVSIATTASIPAWRAWKCGGT